MKITKYRMDQLEEARRLQKECLKQHLPCPPVAWWKAEILDSEGNIEEQIESKCNSYTRNGLNLIATNSMYPSTAVKSNSYFGDGIISYKFGYNGRFSSNAYWYGFRDSTNIIIGTGGGAESLDAFTLSQLINLTAGSTITNTFFDFDQRKLMTVIQKTFTNNIAESVTLTESGIYIRPGAVDDKIELGSMGGTLLVVRDVFQTPIILPVGKNLIFTYNFELLYPQ